MSLLVALDRARSLLKSWIKEKGLTIEEFESDYLILREGDNSILVKIVVFEDIPDTDELNREITLLASRRNEYNKMYIAVSSDIVPLLDGKLLKKLGIGVLELNFEEDVVRERLQSPAISVRKVESIDISRIEKDIVTLVKRIIERELDPIRRELDNLKTYINKYPSNATSQNQTLREKVEKLREEIDSIWDVIDRLKIEIERIKSSISGEVKTDRSSVEKKDEAQERAQPSNVPEFIKDNPWIQILSSKSGRA